LFVDQTGARENGPEMPGTGGRYFHLHLVSDATGETLITASRAVASQYRSGADGGMAAVEHVHSMVRTRQQLDEVLGKIEATPGIVLYTLTDDELGNRLESACASAGLPALSLLGPIYAAFRSYLGAPQERRAGAQHELNKEYFARIEALNFTLIHDDGAMTEDLELADVVLTGISRTSKTPTSIYLANRGIRTANVPLVPGVEPPAALTRARQPLVVALIATAERVFQVRQNRVLGQGADNPSPFYIDRAAIAEELAQTRKYCARYGWPVIDVTRKSIEETASAVLALRAAQLQAREAAQ
jgi:hypothetical protein